ncbi:MAG: VanZ family protein [Candidatus Competibacteraceae bacterium]
MDIPALGRRHAFLAFLAYLAFVVYGSLIPFEYRALSLDEALNAFARIRYLNLGVVSRADWVANLVLYVPLAFLGCVWMAGMRATGAARYLAPVAVFALCLAVAVAVEFTQLFFAPRTVSLNDLLAEGLGTLGGIVLWGFGRWRIAGLWAAFAAGGRPSVLAVLVAYGLVYVVLSLFPYDFIVSARELAWKLDSGNWGWFLADSCAEGWLRCMARLVGEALAIAPLGLLIALAAPNVRYRRVFGAGLALGLVLELLQLLIASGVSQGLSVAMRGAGLVAGLALGRTLRRYGPMPIARLAWWATPFVALPYVLLVAALAGWFAAPWLPVGEALARLADVRFLPFYYHYFTSEPAAMASLLANAALYAPVGLAWWARRAARGAPGRAWSANAALWAALLALVIEFGKLWVPGKHPDFTNLLIAAASAAWVHALAHWIEQVLTGDRSRPAGRETPVAAVPKMRSTGEGTSLSPWASRRRLSPTRSSVV